jgi:hypothetical protein
MNQGETENFLKILEKKKTAGMGDFPVQPGFF